MSILGRSRLYGFLLKLFDRVITLIVAMSYMLLLIQAFRRGGAGLIPMIVVPGVSFVLVSLFRRVYDAKRPYEVYGISPVLKKDTCGRSFPSRHVFSIFVIGMTFYVQDQRAGAVILALGFILAAIRVLGGVHFIRDVVAGAATGVISGLIGFYVIFS